MLFKRELIRITVLAVLGLLVGLVLWGRISFGEEPSGFASLVYFLLPSNSFVLLLIAPLYAVGVFYGVKIILLAAIGFMKAWLIGMLHCRSWPAFFIVLIVPIILLPFVLMVIWIPGCVLAIKELITSYEGPPPQIGRQGRPSRPHPSAPALEPLQEDDDFDF